MNTADCEKVSVLLIVIVSTFFFFSLVPIPAIYGDGESWLDGWSYRKSHVIEKAAEAGTNYQVSVTVDYGSGFDFYDTVYVEEKCRSDFQDIRFTGNDGKTELDYWMEKYDDSRYATFWVEVADNLNSSDVTIYVYYGNDAVSTTSDGDDTFIFFDDFEGDLSSWTPESGTWNISSGKLISADSDDDRIRTTSLISTPNTRIRASVEGSTARCYPLIMARYSSGEFYGYQLQHISGNYYMNMWLYLTGWINIGSDYAVSSSTGEHIFEFDLYSNALTGYHDDTLTHSVSDSTLSSAGYLGIRRGGTSDDNFSVNWIFVAKYVTSEPSHGSWGEEVGNYIPTSTSFTILDMDDTDNLYAQKQYYTAQYVVTDYDGYAEIGYAEFSITQESTVRATFRFDEDTGTFSIESGSSTWDLDVENCSYLSSGKTITINFLISPKFNAIEESNIDIYTLVVSDEGESNMDIIQSDYADVVTDLVVSGFACDDDRGNVGQPLIFSGTVSYADNPSSSTASLNYPPNSEFTAVHIYDSRDVSQGSDTAIINGAFSVSFSALSSVALEAYNPYIDMADPEYIDAKESPTDTFISDRIRILTLGTDNTRVNINDSAEIYATAELEYNGQSLGSGDNLTIQSLDLIWNGTHFVGAESITSVQQKVYDEGEGEEATYGVTVVNMDSMSVSVIWDRLNVLFTVDDDLVPVNTEARFKVTIVREYDNSTVSSYSYNIDRDGSGFGNPHTKSAFTDVCSSEVTRVYDLTYVIDNTYGLTAFTDPKDIFVAWHEDAQSNLLTIVVGVIVIATAIGIGLLIYRKK